MTIVYGVTRIGGRVQVEVRISVFEFNIIITYPYIQNQINNLVPQDKVWDCSNYITALIFDVLKEMFYNARDIQVSLVSFCTILIFFS